MTSMVVLDMSGTTVTDGGLVERACCDALAAVGILPGDPRLPGMLDHIRATMGESKLAVFRFLMRHDEAAAQRVNAAFEAAYGGLVDDGCCTPIDGAADAIDDLRTAGLRVVLTTGFSAATLARVLHALGWQDVADLALCPADAGRGRPYPDLALTALMRLGLDDVRAIATAGDTVYDVLAGLRAGASVVAGVLTGAHGADQLREAGATHVLDSIRRLPGLVLGDRAMLR